MMSGLTRRDFLKYSTAAATAAGTARASTANTSGANDRIQIGVMGCGGRGLFLVREFAQRDDVDIRYLADPDQSRLDNCGDRLEAATGARPKRVADFRAMLEDGEVDAIINATPDHWHALGTILACQAGKDVYVEKPTAHSIWESRKMVEAARKYDRVVQVGAQNRSAEYCKHAFDYIRSDAFGDVHFVRVLNSKQRPTIGAKPDAPVPDGVDYDIWLGPAPMRPFNPNSFHYNWHWFWDFSGGDIINDGVHQIDIARWLIDKKYPASVTSGGGIHYFNDDQETPDTHTVNWEYDGLTMVFEQTLWSPYMQKTPMDVRDREQLPVWPFSGTRIEVHGTKQFMFLSRHGGGWEAFNGGGESVAVSHGHFTEITTGHLEHFLDCIRSRNRPLGDIEDVHYSSLLCMYGNAAYRTGRRVYINAETEGFVDDDEANALVKRSYREPWIVPEEV